MFIYPIVLSILFLVTNSTVAHIVHQPRQVAPNPILDDVAYIGCVNQKFFALTVLEGEFGGGSLTHQDGINACNCLANFGHNGQQYNYTYFDNNAKLNKNCFCSTDQYPPAHAIRVAADATGDCTANEATVTYLHSRFDFSRCISYVTDDPYEQAYNSAYRSSVADCQLFCEQPGDTTPTMSVTPLFNNATDQYQYRCECYGLYQSAEGTITCGPGVPFLYHSADAPSGPGRRRRA